MSYIYHMKPIPFEGSSLIPLNEMDKNSNLFKGHVKKYIGRQDLMEGVIPKLNCKWNDVVQFSALDPQIIVNQLREIQDDFKIKRPEYFKVHIDQIIGKHKTVVFDRNKKQIKGDFEILDEEVVSLDKSYQEISEVPNKTMEFWNEAKQDGGKFLWFAFIPHVLVQGIIDTSEFEVCSLK